MSVPMRLHLAMAVGVTVTVGMGMIVAVSELVLRYGFTLRLFLDVRIPT